MNIDTPPGPAAPPDHIEDLASRVYAEAPGGNTLVLALLINANGEVLSAKIMVPSAHPFMDINIPLIMLGRKLGNPNPPLAPGDTKWVDFYYRYPSNQDVLP